MRIKELSRRRIAKAIIYYAITRHGAGFHNAPNDVSIKAPDHTGGFYLERKQADGTVRDTKQALPWEPPSAYLEGDVNAISVPLDKITEFRTRYNQVKELLFSFSDDMPNVELIWLRGNQMQLSESYSDAFDLTNCTKLSTLDISDNYIERIKMPATSNLNFIYVGGLFMDGEPHPEYVTAEILSHVYNNSIDNGQMLSDPCTIKSLGDNVDMHEELVNLRGWEIGHLTCAVPGYYLNNTAQSFSFDVMSSKYDWSMWSDDNGFITLHSNGEPKSKTRTQGSFSITANDTGAERTGHLYLQKMKDDGSAYKGITVITVTQAG